jgi:hypothetical protein
MVATTSTIIAAAVGALLGLVFNLFSVDRKDIITKNGLYNALKTEIKFVEENMKDYLDQKSMNDSFGNGQVSKLKPMIYPLSGLINRAGIEEFLTDDRLNVDIYSYYYYVSVADKYNEIQYSERFPFYNDEFYNVILNVHTIGNKLTDNLVKTISRNNLYFYAQYVFIFIIVVIILLGASGIIMI